MIIVLNTLGVLIALISFLAICAEKENKKREWLFGTFIASMVFLIIINYSIIIN